MKPAGKLARSGSPPALYVVTDRKATAGRPLLDVLAAALSGATAFRRSDGTLPVAVCLREKDLSASELTLLAKAVRELTKSFGVDLFVNSRFDVALACEADGVHLPVDEIAPDDVRAINPTLRIAASTHTMEEVRIAARAGAEFVVFGPVFATPSKHGLLEPRGLQRLREASSVGVPVLALGGIVPDHAGLCIDAGASGVAVVRAVLAADDPARELVAFLARYREPN